MEGKKKTNISKKKIKYMKQMYNTPSQPGSFSAPETFLNELNQKGRYKFTLKQVKAFLSTQEPYLVTRQRREKFLKPKYRTYYKFQLLQSDLMYMADYAKDNDGVQYLLTILDTFTRQLWVKPLHDRKGETVTKAFKEFLDSLKPTDKIHSLLTDRGIEYRSKVFKELMNQYHINHYFSTTGGAMSVERVHLTLRSKLMKFFIKNNTSRYIDKLQQFVSSYNRTKHSVTLKKPVEIDFSNQYEVYKHIKSKEKEIKKKPFRFSVNDKVLISYKRTIFDRQFSERFSRQVYTIARRYRNQNVNLYKLIDCNDELVKGSFYESELQIVIEDPKKYMRIEKILKRRNGESLVKFEWYPRECARWVRNREIKDLQN